MKKEREELFTKVEINDAQCAMEIKSKAEAKLQRVKLGLIIAAVAQAIWVIIFAVSGMPAFLSKILFYIAIIGTAAAYIIGGGLGAAFKTVWKVSKAIGRFGWICVPFPVDIFTGILLTFFSIMTIPLLFIFIPLIVVFFSYRQVRKDLDAAEEYLI